MSGDKQPGVKWSGPEGARPITLADFQETQGLLAWLFGDTDRSEQVRPDPGAHRCELTFEKGHER